MKRTSVLILILLVAAVSCKRGETPVATQTTTGSSTAEPSKPKPAEQVAGTDVGAIMPAYSATWLDGSKFELTARRDKVVLLNLWATWCGPCRFEIPELQKMHAELGPKGFEVIGVSVDEGGVDTVKQFVEEHQMTYPIVIDPEGKLANLFQTSVLPTTALIDRNGKIVWKHYGLIEANDVSLKQAIERAL
jgi:cytochrome c biogenesis protein CcmG, thiol:disulfide interchange protein DsbE